MLKFTEVYECVLQDYHEQVTKWWQGWRTWVVCELSIMPCSRIFTISVCTLQYSFITKLIPSTSLQIIELYTIQTLSETSHIDLYRAGGTSLVAGQLRCAWSSPRLRSCWGLFALVLLFLLDPCSISSTSSRLVRLVAICSYLRLSLFICGATAVTACGWRRSIGLLLHARFIPQLIHMSHNTSFVVVVVHCQHHWYHTLIFGMERCQNSKAMWTSAGNSVSFWK